MAGVDWRYPASDILLFRGRDDSFHKNSGTLAQRGYAFQVGRRLCPGEVTAIAGIDANGITFFDEVWHLDR